MKKFLFSLLLFVIFSAFGNETTPPPPPIPTDTPVVTTTPTDQENKGETQGENKPGSEAEKKEDDEPKVYFDAKNRKITVTTTHEGIEVEKPSVTGTKKTFSFEQVSEAKEYLEFLIADTHN